MKRSIKVIIVTILLIILLLLLWIIIKQDKETSKIIDTIYKEDKEKNIEENNFSNKQQENKFLSDKQETEVINELKGKAKNKTDKVILIINGEKISEKEISIIDFQINNKYLNSNREKKE